MTSPFGHISVTSRDMTTGWLYPFAREGVGTCPVMFVSRKRRPKTAKRPVSRGPRRPRKKVPWWRHPLVWAGSLATLLAGGAATAFGTGLGQSMFAAVHDAPSATAAPSGPPVMIDSVTPDSGRSDFSYVLPQRTVLTPQQLHSLNELTPDKPQYDQWFTSRGGVVPSPAVLNLVVEGNRPHPVLIIDMGITDQCTQALNGTLFANGTNGGPVADLGVSFDLDLARPVPVNGLHGGSYFAAHSISLRKGEQMVFAVVSSSSRYCQYQITLTVVDGTRTLTETVSNDGKPFKVTGRLPEAGYAALYVGGTEPGETAPFTRENPATGRPY